MPETAHVIAGRCTPVLEGTRKKRGSATQEQHGDMIGLVKPDSTEESLVDHL